MLTVDYLSEAACIAIKLPSINNKKRGREKEERERKKKGVGKHPGMIFIPMSLKPLRSFMDSFTMLKRLELVQNAF